MSAPYYPHSDETILEYLNRTTPITTRKALLLHEIGPALKAAEKEGHDELAAQFRDTIQEGELLYGSNAARYLHRAVRLGCLAHAGFNVQAESARLTHAWDRFGITIEWEDVIMEARGDLPIVHFLASMLPQAVKDSIFTQMNDLKNDAVSLGKEDESRYFDACLRKGQLAPESITVKHLTRLLGLLAAQNLTFNVEEDVQMVRRDMRKSGITPDPLLARMQSHFDGLTRNL